MRTVDVRRSDELAAVPQGVSVAARMAAWPCKGVNEMFCPDTASMPEAWAERAPVSAAMMSALNALRASKPPSSGVALCR